MKNHTINNTSTSTDVQNATSNHQLCSECQEQRIDALVTDKRREPEAIARNMKAAARTGQVMANILLAVEIFGLFAVAKATFSNGFFGAFCTASMFVAIITIFTKLALSRAEEALKERLFWGFIIIGALLALIGMVGFVQIRATAPLIGREVDFGQFSIGNFMLMLGLTLGVPLVIGSLHNDSCAKFERAEALLDDINERKGAAL